MTKRKSKRLLSLLLSLAVVFTLTVTPVFAADTDASGEVTVGSTAEESADEDVNVDEDADVVETEESEEESKITAEDVQSMIDALPDAEDITADNAADVESQLDAIDEARNQIGEDADYVVYTRYDAACTALKALYSVHETSTNATAEIDELVLDVELPDGAERSAKIAASGSAVSIEDTAEGTPKVSYGDSTYSTVSAAIEAIETDGLIKLTGDVSESSITIPAGKTITLDLGGYTLTLTGGTTYTDTGYTGSTFRASLVNQGKLTVKNGTILGNGTYTTDNTNYYYVQNMILNTGTLNVESGVTVTGKLYTVTNLGGTVITEGNITATYYDAVVTYGGNVTVNNGTIEATNSSYYGSAIDIFDRNYNRPTSNDGTGSTVTINGGTIKAYCYNFSTNNQCSGYSNLNIYGGTIESVFCCIYWPTPGTITIGSATSTSDETPYLKNTGGSGIVICCGTLNVYSGTIEATYGATTSTPFDSTTWAANYRASSGMTGLADAISIIANRSSAYAEYALTVNLAGGTYISASNYAVRYLNCNAASDSDTDTSQVISVTLGGGTYIGGTTTDGTNVAAIDTCEYKDTSNIKTLTVTGGTYSSDVDEYTTSTTAAVANGDSTYTVVEHVENAVALVYDGDKNYVDSYKTLSDAYNATPSGGTLILVGEISAPESGNTLSVYKTMTLDLNGQTLNGDSGIAVFVSASGVTLTIKDSSSDGTGKINGSGGSGLVRVMSGAVVIEGGTYTSAGNVLKTSGSDASITVNSGTFTSSGSNTVSNAGGTITINGGTFTAADSTPVIGLAESPTSVSITGGTFENSISYNYEGVGTSATRFAGIIKIFGGKFKTTTTWLIESYLADGYAVVADKTEGYYTVSIQSAVLSYTSNGSTVTKGYSSVQAAINAVADLSDANNITVTMYANYSARVYVTSGEFTLDLNGCTITSDTSDGIALLVSGGTVTVIDSSEDQTGTVTMTENNTNGSALVRVTGGTVTLAGGHYKPASNQGTIGVSEGATLTITGGYFTSDPSTYVAEGYIAEAISGDTYKYTVIYGILLGVSTDTTTTVPAVPDSGYGENTMYVKVEASNISTYSKDAYPTTNLTFTENGEEHNYIFAGWYSASTDEAGTYTAMETFPIGDAYAKFVDADVLTVKAQILATTTAESETTNLRFISTVDTSNYSDVGFRITFNGSTITRSSSTVYEEITGTNGEKVFEYAPTVFSSASKYFVTYSINNIPRDSFEAAFTVSACWTTLDGTTVYGVARTITVQEIFQSTSNSEGTE